ncbi:autoinducer binding domain-containing protein [Roseovarius salis]|uniref:LuxR family transcriptional regulator n=1 Tax=Roseovarius salis TaxID=3376063 RepID=UPI0037CB78A0
MIPSDELNALITANSVEELWDMHTRRMAEYGFDRLIYGFSRFMTETSLGDPEDFILLSNHDPAYMEKFIGEGLFHNAPMVRWAREHDGPQSWALIGKMKAANILTPEEQRVIEFNRSMGVAAGFTISFKSVSARAKGAIGLTARKGVSQADVDALWARHGEDILLLNNLTHLRIMSLPHRPLARPLTPRQREVLEWVSAGKTVQDIALLMGLTRVTVEKHLRLAREALGAETTAQAVVKAAFQQQIFALSL